MRFQFYVDAAKKKSGAPDHYCAYYVGIEGVPKNLKNSTKVILTEVSEYKSGTKKGKKRYHQNTAVTVFVTTEEVEAAEREFIEKNKCCPTCLGEKQLWNGWSRTEGNSYRPCTDCK